MTYRELYLDLKHQAIMAEKEESAVTILFLETAQFTYKDLIINYDSNIPNDIYVKIMQRFTAYIKNNIPVQYILGYTYFYGIKIKVNTAVLIPRPETEILVEKALGCLEERINPKIIDIGCGSGAIALALKKNLPCADITAVDISPLAIETAQANAVELKLNICFMVSDLFSNVVSKFDVIVSNPPYLAGEYEAESLVRNNEPPIALYAPDKGLYYYYKILTEAPHYLNNPGLILLEIPTNKAEDIMAILAQFGLENKSTIEKDLNNQNRILIIKYD